MLPTNRRINLQIDSVNDPEKYRVFLDKKLQREIRNEHKPAPVVITHKHVTVNKQHRFMQTLIGTVYKCYTFTVDTLEINKNMFVYPTHVKRSMGQLKANMRKLVGANKGVLNRNTEDTGKDNVLNQLSEVYNFSDICSGIDEMTMITTIQSTVLYLVEVNDNHISGKRVLEKQTVTYIRNIIAWGNKVIQFYVDIYDELHKSEDE